MTDHDALRIMNRASALRKAGDEEGARALAKTVPMPWYLAEIWKKYVGKESLKASGWNMEEVEAHFGKGWIDS
ncbi:MAG: hypothetical protein LBR16_03350 [Treponema sp.]|nr:hypothetical protein [Treponema sp.]